MSKSKTPKAVEPSATTTCLTARFAAQGDSVDPALASLFASSAGPVGVPAKPAQTTKRTSVPVQPSQEDETTSNDDDSEAESEPESLESSPEDEATVIATEIENEAERPRKRKRAAQEDNLEQAYFKRLQREEDKEMEQKKAEQHVEDADTSPDEDNTSSSGSDDDSMDEPGDIEEAIPRHEVFDKKQQDQDKVQRTVFLGNVSTEAIKSKIAKRALTRHLRSVLKTPAQGKRLGKLESVRFRSTAYASSSGPKKATFAKKELMDATTTSTNAYAVFTTQAAAEHVADKLNGTVVLDRHLRVDCLAKPLPIENKRCVFVGNLSFVNEETVPQDQGGEPNAEGGTKPKRRPTAKQPADAEEGLWRTFSKVGEVESVRVVRDQETRVSKGIAYVQFKDENGVEAALLLNEKKFPPMLPRKLRIMRAKKTRTNNRQSSALPSGKNRFGMKGKGARGGSGSGRGPIVFEGHRASESSGGVRKGKSSGSGDVKRERNRKRPNLNSARRGVQFRRAKAGQQKAGGK